jgi:drug/metabolite transporter (DMT)-like permease
VFAGLALGLLGLALLIGPDAFRGSGDVNPVGAGVLMVGSLSWAIGSLYTQRAPKPSSGAIGSGTQMVAGGVCSLVVALASGELSQLDLAHVSSRSALSLVYLITFGSLIGFTAYLYMLAHTTAAKAATYAYVNPIVAVLLGWWLAGEPVTMRTVAAAAVILAGVAIITVARDKRVSAPREQRAAA